MSEILPPQLDSSLLSSLGLSASAPLQSVSVYNCVLHAEQAAIYIFNQSGGTDKVAKGHIIASRVLGCLLYVFHERPTFITAAATSTIRTEILNDTTDDRNSLIYNVGAMYRDHLLRAFRTTMTPPPPTPQHPSRPTFDKMVDKWGEDLVSANLNYDTSRKKALARDGYRCKLTQSWKDSSCKEIRELAQMAREFDTGRGNVQVCHIVNESLAQHIDGDTASGKLEVHSLAQTTQRDSAASFLRILDGFGMREIATKLAEANGVHSLANLLCLLTSVHANFDDLAVWFEPTSKEHEYTVHTAYSIATTYGHWQDNVTFSVFPHRHKAFRNAELPLPDPKLLTLHGICARVAHMSGAVEYFDEIDRDMESLMVLASDGSTSTAFFESVLALYTSTLSVP
ncbi:hypothetical protein BDZ89DRAFT_1059481 [Hymenopellis radicata]|nr:hypothetical protein BDZ89DRAFT_1059481 [Hymenopellis radicata]